MAESYGCWIPDWGDEDDGCAVSARDAQDAARDYCDSRYAADGGSWPGSVVVHVRESSGIITQFEVTIDWSPSFYATALKHGPRRACDREREWWAELAAKGRP